MVPVPIQIKVTHDPEAPFLGWPGARIWIDRHHEVAKEIHRSRESLEHGMLSELVWRFMGLPLESRRTVLMAEPLDDSHDFYVSWFAGEGFHVIGTGRGDIALAMIDESAPDLLVIDFGLTGVDTAQVISRLRRSAATVSLPIVLLTRHDDAASLESVRCLDVAILPKLGDTRELQETLQRLLSAAPPRRLHRSVAPLIDRFCDDEWLARFRES